MHRGLQEHRWETAFGSFVYDPVLWARPGWFEDSFSLNLALPGHHFGGAQGYQNDAQGTQKGAKMMPREPKSQGK